MSNLLDKASIVTTPTAYENGKILSVKPNTSVGDFDFTRNSSATRVNSQGLIEDMQILSGDLVSNGDFSVDGIVNSSSYTLGWYTTDSGISISAGKLIITNGGSVGGRAYGTNGVNSISFITSGKSYKLVYTIEENNDNALVSYHNGGSYVTAPNTVGTHTIYYQAGGTIFILRNLSANTTIKIDNVSLIEITEDTNLPRIDYTGGVGHWLFEPQSTNLLTYSEDFSQENTWVDISVSLESGYLAPDGTNNAYKVTSTSSSSFLYATGDYTQTTHKSIYARTLSGTGTISLCNRSSDPNALFTITEQWQRFDISHSDTELFYAVDFRASGATLSEVIIWGAQLEQQSFATSIIPTEGSIKTRLADAAFGAGSSDLINSTEGVLYAEIAALANDGTNRIISLSDGTNTHRVLLAYTAVTNQIQAFSNNGVDTVNLIFTASNVTNFNKIAFKYKLNDFALWIDGAEVSTNSSGTTNVANTLNNFKFENASGTSDFYGKTKCVAVFKEALTNDELECLTGEGYDSFNALALANNYTII